MTGTVRATESMHTNNNTSSGYGSFTWVINVASDNVTVRAKFVNGIGPNTKWVWPAFANPGRLIVVRLY